jgi:glycosyltransferase involved in cell wall biosynthesis
MSFPLPPVAVVIPLHNGARWIRSTLAAVQAQSHPPAEIVVVDDGSTDAGPALAAAVDGVTVRPLARPSVQGAGPGRQCGLEQTTAPLVAFLDQDDLWHPDHLRLLAGLLADRPDCPAAVASTRDFHDGATPTYDPPRWAPAPLDPWSSFPLNVIHTPSSALVRRAALEAVGGWPTCGPVTDFLAWFLLSMERPLVENQCATCAYRSHASSHGSRNKTNRRSTFLQYKVDLLSPLLPRRHRHAPQQAERLRVRLDALQAAAHLTVAYDNGRSDLVLKAASPLEALASTDPEHFDNLLAFLFWYFLKPDFQGSPDRQLAFLEILLSAWPSWAPRSGRRLEALFLRSFSIWTFLSFLRRRPFRLSRWRLGLVSGWHSVRHRWDRLRRRLR